MNPKNEYSMVRMKNRCHRDDDDDDDDGDDDDDDDDDEEEEEEEEEKCNHDTCTPQQHRGSPCWRSTLAMPLDVRSSNGDFGTVDSNISIKNAISPTD